MQFISAPPQQYTIKAALFWCLFESKIMNKVGCVNPPICHRERNRVERGDLEIAFRRITPRNDRGGALAMTGRTSYRTMRPCFTGSLKHIISRAPVFIGPYQSHCSIWDHGSPPGLPREEGKALVFLFELYLCNTEPLILTEELIHPRSCLRRRQYTDVFR